MKNKRTSVTILLLFCILVWGMIGWKVYSGLQATAVTLPVQKTIEKVEKKEIGLLLNYRDPFLDHSREKVEASGQPTQAVRHSVKSSYTHKEEVTPDFQYMGHRTKRILRVGRKRRQTY